MASPPDHDGERVRREVLGDAHVDRAAAAATDLDRPFQDYITDSVWAKVWNRPGLTRRERSMVTVAILAARGQLHEVGMHARAGRRTGMTAADLTEVMLHVAAYAGVPAANAALAEAKRALADEDPASS